MDSKCNNEQLKRDGTSQGGRYLKALDPANMPLDDRSVEDILVFAKHYAGLVRYYDTNEDVEWANTENDKQARTSDEKQEQRKATYDWKEFFYQDIAVLIASIAGYKNKLELIRQDYEERRKQTDLNPNIQNFRELFKVITHLLQRIDRWYKRSIPQHPLKEELELKINSVLKPALKKLMAYDRGSNIIKDDGIEIEEEYAVFVSSPWDLKYKLVPEDESIYVGNSKEQRIKYASPYVDDVFQETVKVYKDITGRSDHYFSIALEKYPDHEPHMALFIAFVKLFMYAQKEMNGLTQRHLDFYYREVLHLHERSAVPDKVYLVYELAKEATGYDLKKCTPLTAGKDAIGKELIYKTETELTINKAKVKELKTVFLEKDIDGENKELIKKIYASPVANSADGLGAPFKNPESAWPALGYVKLNRKVDDSQKVIITNPQDIIGKEAEIGFAIASPQLFLAEGVRRIIILGIDFSLLNNAIEIQLTGEKGWIKINLVEADILGDLIVINNTVKRFFIGTESITINIPVAEEAIVAYDERIHGKGFQTNYPVIKLIIKDSSCYNQLKDKLVSSLSLKVDVKGVKNLILENDQSVLDSSKSILPFTQTPKKGYTFYIGSKEVFFKKLNSLVVRFESIEEANVDTPHVKKGGPPAELNVAILNDKSWKYIPQKPAAGAASTNSYRVYKYAENLTVLSDSEDLFTNKREINYKEFPDRNSALAGFMKLDLISDVVTDIVIDDNKKVVLPKTFILKNMELDYTSQEAYLPGLEQFFHIYPFGTIETFPVETGAITSFEELDKSKDNLMVKTSFLLPQFKYGLLPQDRKNYYNNQYTFKNYQQGNLFIGIEHLKPPQNLSLLFKIADGTAEDNDSDPPTINWSYLVNNEWRPLPPQHIVSDSTYGLQTTGIMLFDFPADATNNNTVVTTGLHWLSASADIDADKLPKIINIIAQASKAVFADNENDSNHYKVPLPANSITKLSVKVPEVKIIQQPFETFDGKMKEEGNVFYARVSERLRHKHRAITPWDYEHLILQHFPSVYKVKCLTHTDPNCICRHPRTGTPPAEDKAKCCCGQVSPGHVLIIPVSNLRNKEAVDILKPRTGRKTLLQIEDYLKKIISPFVHVKARNPKFEEIKTAFHVKFNIGTDKGRYLKQLNEDIIKFLTPWAFDKNKEVVFGGSIYASGIINFIEELEYVDYITCFRMIHIVKGCCKQDTLPNLICDDMNKEPEDLVPFDAEEEDQLPLQDRIMTVIEPTSPMAILTSVREHCIELIEEKPEQNECSCL